MADSNSLKVVSLFEAGARLKSGTEIIGLAAHIFHRFFRLNQDMNQFELYTFGCACIKLAYWFYERPLDCKDLALVMTSIIHGPKHYLNNQSLEKLVKSVDFAAKIIAINLDYSINYKDTRMITPGELARMARSAKNGQDEIMTIDIAESDDDEYDHDLTDRLLSKNSKHSISSHRYLTHYLKTINLLVEPNNLEEFKKVCAIAWTFLNDFYWSLSVTQSYNHHIACACLVMAIEISRKKLESSSIEKGKLWKLLNKKWNLIFCDDLSNEQLDRMINIIVKQYCEYERVLEYEFSSHVIRPT